MDGTTYGSLMINTSSGATLVASASIGGSGTLSLASGTFNLNSHPLTLVSGSTINRSGGSLSGSTLSLSGTQNLIYSGTTAITTGNELSGIATLGNLTITDSGGVSLGSNAQVDGTLALGCGTLAYNGHALTLAP